MKKRILTLTGFLAAGVCLTLATLAMLPPGPGVSKANLDRIKIGMSEADVAAIFAKDPVGAYPTAGGSGCVWESADGKTATVEFDLEFRVRGTNWSEPEESLGEKFQRWLRWPWW